MKFGCPYLLFNSESLRQDFSHHSFLPGQQMLSFRGVSACIRVDGVDLPCFQPEYSEDMRTATCWIPSEAGKEYTVSWTQIDVKTKTAGRILLDGSQKPAASASLCDGKSCSRSAATLSAAEERPFVFSSIQASGECYLLGWQKKLKPDVVFLGGKCCLPSRARA